MNRILLSMGVGAVMGLFVVGCGGTEEVEATTQTSSPLSAEAELVSSESVGLGFRLGYQAWGALPSDGSTRERDHLSVMGVSLEGDDLLIEVQHGGGCRRHDYAVLWDGAFLESEPVQVQLRLQHDSNGDLCRALLRSTLRIPLEALRADYREAYRTESGQIRIQVEGAPDLEVTDSF